ncbi:endonuclease/exonuclease/phosphatase family protein [Marinobacterium rhizophilum]|uniref:Endonuclease/exonuclease/phosphatase family protein n=1 Tax=Marinobacterium rhizophilum TaxID=420402 RepID=A0ABY5HJT0_9GAMM|nr:endonuclease/exonuclease/phosphatase family protein [Marinobacterium rhizophilum]UTW12646.1 endonuclease/exonuclease/phosphatase family protein [Marinobacterium rhizophilum]
MTLTLFLLASLFIALLTLLPLWNHEAWWVRGLDFPRVQLISLILGTLLLAVWLLDLSRPQSLALITLNLACLAYHAWWVFPYSRLHAVEVKASTPDTAMQPLSILTSNVLASNRHADCLIDLVNQHKPDILVTLESDNWWQQQLDTLAADYPHSIRCPLDNLYGMHVYSRLPLQESTIEYLVEPDVPSMHTQILLPNGARVRAHFLHPAPPSPTENEASAERDAELLAVARSVADNTLPVVVTGDLNDVAWSSTTRLFRKISGLRDPRIGRGMFNTFHAEHWFIRWPLDHIFHSHHFRVLELQRLCLKGSDHFALLSRLDLRHGEDNGERRLHPTPEDSARADIKMQNQDVAKSDVPVPAK